jgi:hypothetical protein
MEDKMSVKTINRRTLLKGLASIPVVTIVGTTANASAAQLSGDDATAKSVGYISKSSQNEERCGTCALYKGGSEASGRCPLFTSKEVNAVGWCKFWVVKG